MSGTTETVTLSVADGTTMQTYVARPEGRDRRPAVLLPQEAFGGNEPIRGLAGRRPAGGRFQASREGEGHRRPGVSSRPFPTPDRTLRGPPHDDRDPFPDRGPDGHRAETDPHGASVRRAAMVT